MEKARILVADDDPVSSSGVARSLELELLEVARAGSPARAIELLRSQSFDLVVSAFEPASAASGELLRYVREQHGGTPVIILTESEAAAGAVEALRPGVDDLIRGPCRAKELSFRIRGCLDRAALGRANDELGKELRERSAELVRGRELLEAEIARHERAKELLATSLHERGLLLREFQHRIKNNLATIAALANLGSICPSKASQAESMAQLARRVRAIYLVYEKISREPAPLMRSFGDYVRTLAQELFQAAGRSSDEITLEVDVDDMDLELDRAIPLGLIIHELVSNSLVHAFPPGTPGSIRVRLERVGESSVLTVADTGVGFPAGFDITGAATLGCRLVATLADQLGGRVELIRSRGAAVAVRFPLSQQGG